MNMEQVKLFSDDFSSFEPADFPFDREHSAMGEYHFYPQPGYTGQWYDPIVNCNFRGPSWIITESNGTHFMEQMRVSNPSTNGVCSILAAGDELWKNYILQASVRFLCTKESAGLLFRYQTSLMHYAFFLCNQKAEIWKIEKKEKTLLAEIDFAYDCDTLYTLSIECVADVFRCSVNGNFILSATDNAYTHGKIGLAGYMPAQFTSVEVMTDKVSYEKVLKQKADNLDRISKKRLQYAQPRLNKIINLENFGAGRQIRFGHLLGGAEWFFVIAQHQKRVFKERYCNISCLTAVSMETGKILWQIGKPSSIQNHHLATCDLPFQVYDINNDGIDEVIVAKDFKIQILDGRTGEELSSILTPLNEDLANKIEGIEFKKHAFDRLNVDAIRIVNVSGKEKPSDILIKDRYARLWVYDQNLTLLWKFCHNNTGHFPVAYDFNGDGKDEIFSCYNMISSTGKLLWSLPIKTDHTDEIIFGKIDPDSPPLLAIVSGWEGFMLVDYDGNIRARDINGHGQRISVANYSSKASGFKICTTTYWENQGIVYLYDCKGKELWHRELPSNGNIIAPVNWSGNGSELILLNGNIRYGGMLDGEGDVVVCFPDDDHPDLCAEVINIMGDNRDEIILWDSKKMYIYTQEDSPNKEKNDYCPEKYPHYNSSNYRGEYSFPHN